MKDYISIEKVVKLISDSTECTYNKIKGKKIMFEAILSNGKRSILCTPQASYQLTIKACWVDITLVQFELMQTYDNAVVVFRLDGEMLSMVKWCDLKVYLTKEAMKYNNNEQFHWKLHIDENSIKVVGNKQLLSNTATKINLQ